jgi:hypothetical protein
MSDKKIKIVWNRKQQPRPKTKKEKMSDFWEAYFRHDKKGDFEKEEKTFFEKDEKWERKKYKKLYERS